MQITKTVANFLSRTESRNKVYFFHYENDSFSMPVWEVAGEYTRQGGKINNKNVVELGNKFAAKRGLKNCCIQILDRANADNYL